MSKTTFHASNFGSFGGNLPTDTEGYVHLTIKGWIAAGYSRDEARELAARAKEAVADAEKALENWRSK
jgi:hypothetical protein